MKKNFLRKIKNIKKGNHAKKVRKNNKTQKIIINKEILFKVISLKKFFLANENQITVYYF